jgi:flagellar motility protein MotE (MotC chaperone)
LQEKVLELSRRHGGVNNFSTVLLGHESLQLAEQEEEIVEKEIASMKQEIEVLEASKERLEEENRELSKTVGGYNRELAEISILYNAGWDIGNLTLAGLLTKQWGGVKDIFGGMMKFASLKEIEAKLEAKKAELDGSGASGGVANGKPAPKAKTMEEIIDEIRDSKIDLDNPKK